MIVPAFLKNHIGKLVKLGIGMFNTHSRNGDGRIETLLSCALEADADLDILREIQKCVTTNAVLDILHENGLLDRTMEILNGRIQHNINRRIPDEIEVGFICFANTGEYEGVLFESENAKELMVIGGGHSTCFEQTDTVIMPALLEFYGIE